MLKEELKQYRFVQIEIEQMENAIKKCEDALIRLNEEGMVQDIVKGGDGGWQTFHIEGFPVTEYERRKRILNTKKARLQKRRNDMLELEEKILSFIDGIENKRDALMLRMAFIDGCSYEDIGNQLFCDKATVSRIISKYC